MRLGLGFRVESLGLGWEGLVEGLGFKDMLLSCGDNSRFPGTLTGKGGDYMWSEKRASQPASLYKAAKGFFKGHIHDSWFRGSTLKNLGW